MIRLTLILCLFFLPTIAFASEAIVGALMIQDARGRWVPVTETAEAVAIRDGEVISLKQSKPLLKGDVIETQNARVEIIWTQGEAPEQIYVWEYAKVTLSDERSVVQELGDLYYRLRGSFSIQYGTVETMVDGTAFQVSGPNPVSVGVTEGVVRVREGGQEQRLTPGQMVSVSSGAGVPAAARWAGSAKRAAKGKSYMDGFAHTEAGVMFSGSGAPISAQVYGQFRFAKTLQLRLESGFVMDDGYALPQNIEFSYRMGGFALGGRGQVSMYSESVECEAGCDASLLALSAAGSGIARYSFLFGPRLVGSVDLEGGAVVYPDGVDPFVQGRIGVGVSF